MSLNLVKSYQTVWADRFWWFCTTAVKTFFTCTFSSCVFILYSTLVFSFLSLEGGQKPSEPLCKVIFENEQQEPATPSRHPGAGGRRRSMVSSEPQHVTLIVFGIGIVNRTHLEADIGGLTMEAELKKIHGSFTLKEKMKGEADLELLKSVYCGQPLRNICLVWNSVDSVC